MSASLERVERVFRGLAVSTGVAHGRVRHVGTRFEEPAYRKVPAAHIEFELARFRNAIRNARRPMAAFSPAMAEKNRAIKDFLFARMYRHWRVNRMTAKARPCSDVR